MNKIIFQIIATLFCIHSFAQEKTDTHLKKEVEKILAGFHGQVGVYIKDLRKGKVVAINSDTTFPTASMVKIPIMIGVMSKLQTGELKDTQNLVYNDSLLYEGVDILGSFKSGEKIELQKVMMLMLTMSDNTASLWLQSLAGTGIRINEILDSMGFRVTRVNSRTPGREEARSIFGWGQTTPKEMATLMEMIYKGKVISEEASARMLRLTSRNFWDEVSISQIPAGVFISSKNGAVDESRSEVLFVNAPHRPYIFCICTKNNSDTSWQYSNEAWVMTRKLSALLWNHFEPSSKNNR
jgi:beta-lactamase class A